MSFTVIELILAVIVGMVLGNLLGRYSRPSNMMSRSEEKMLDQIGKNNHKDSE